MNSFWRLIGATATAGLVTCIEAKAVDWQPLQDETESSHQQKPGSANLWQKSNFTPDSFSTKQPVIWEAEKSPKDDSQLTNWEEVPSSNLPTKTVPTIFWTPVKQDTAAEIEENLENGQPINNPFSETIEISPPVMPSGTTFANDKAIWRDDSWYPQISSIVPVGFGPKGWMGSAGIYGWDCTATGICKAPKSWNGYKKQIESFGEAEYNISVGFGNAEKNVGVVVTTTIEETKLPFGDRNTQGLDTDSNLFDEYYIGLHLARNIGPDTGIRVGIKNWIDVKECGLDCGYPKSAYAVISQRFRLNQNQRSWFSNAYLTAGVGNGEFRPLDEQVRASIASQRANGCQTYGYIPDKPCSSTTLRRAVLDAANYGQLTPIGAVAVEVFPGFNAIGEWTGRNLNMGFSVRPFEEVGLVFTTMWNQLLKNCDYGCDIRVPDFDDAVPLPENMITFRPVWSFQLSLNLKF